MWKIWTARIRIVALATGIQGSVTFLFPGAAFANQGFAASHCDAAVETGDWTSVTIYCQSAAEEYLVQAANEEGDIKAVHTMSAAFYITDVGVAYRHLGNSQSASEKFTEARRLFKKAIGETHNKEALDLAAKGLSELPH